MPEKSRYTLPGCPKIQNICSQNDCISAQFRIKKARTEQSGQASTIAMPYGHAAEMRTKSSRSDERRPGEKRHSHDSHARRPHVDDRRKKVDPGNSVPIPGDLQPENIEIDAVPFGIQRERRISTSSRHRVPRPKTS